MSSESACTYVVPPARTSAAEVRATHEGLAANALLRGLFEAVPQPMALLNRQRQVVYFNPAFLATLEVGAEKFPWGARMGELLRCVNVESGPSGCGTSEACRYCGQARAIQQAWEGAVAVEPCLILARREAEPEALELRTTTAPLAVDGVPYVLTTLVDISPEKRRRVLERIFFHDVLNTASLVLGYAQLLPAADVAQQSQSARRIVEAAEQLIGEIEEQRELAAAESGELRARPRGFDARKLLERMVDLFAPQELARDRRLVVTADTVPAAMSTDRTLLQRVVGNMVKNALEATPAGGEVRLTCAAAGGRIRFSVWSPAPMPHEVQAQVFRRSFSTKHAQRGLGTWSMKLLTERYLRGRVWFTTGAEEGTTFHAEVPARLRAEGERGGACFFAGGR